MGMDDDFGWVGRLVLYAPTRELRPGAQNLGLAISTRWDVANPGDLLVRVAWADGTISEANDFFLLTPEEWSEWRANGTQTG